MRQYPNTDGKGITQRRIKPENLDEKLSKTNVKSRRSSRLSFNIESSCLVLTPKLMRQLISASSNLTPDALDNPVDEEPVKVHSIKPSSLLKYLFQDKLKNGLSENIKMLNELSLNKDIAEDENEKGEEEPSKSEVNLTIETAGTTINESKVENKSELNEQSSSKLDEFVNDISNLNLNSTESKTSEASQTEAESLASNEAINTQGKLIAKLLMFNFIAFNFFLYFF